ncbi:hypothetical protein ACFCZR_07200 [Streptomyces rubiginosohelvolus]|uniref:hypothetical protein n=1 Tax=Streptomyces rubiginosohelvolus TaxID=67362 RepID=UPI0035D725B7
MPRIFRTVGSGTSSSTPRTPTNVQERVSPAGFSKAKAVALPSSAQRPVLSAPVEVAVATLPVRPGFVVNGFAAPVATFSFAGWA